MADQNDVVVLCADGSELSIRALENGLDLLGSGRKSVVVCVVHPTDPMLVTGTGFAAGTMTPQELQEIEAAATEEGAAIAREAAQALGLGEDAAVVLHGDAGTAICDYADEVGAAAIVIGTRGRGGVKRALLGSVSDYVIRHATCPVVVTNPKVDD